MKRITILAVLAFFFQFLSAAPIGREQARELAMRFYARSMPAKGPVSANDFVLAYPSSEKSGEGALCYAFNVEGGRGFVLVSGDDALDPVLAYSYEGSFASGPMPENLKYWIGEYERQIGAYRKASRSGSLAGGAAPSMPKSDPAVIVSPLLENHEDGAIVYDQGYPYNKLCPDPDERGQNMYTGCVATALAQIARFYEYPEQGTGSISYETDWGKLETDFSRSAYDWDNMLTEYVYGGSYTETQIEAIAVLMRDMGYAVRMNYGYDGSGAYDLEALYGVQTYMGYTTLSRYLQREYYTDEQWHSFVRGELDEGRPVYYSGTGETDGGHAFVCDGYNDAHYFHFNWGWSGVANGWYKLESLIPEETGIGAGLGDYSYNQGIFLNLRPSEGETEKIGCLLYAGDSKESLACEKGTYPRNQGLECEAYGFYSYSPDVLEVEFGMGYWQNGHCVKVVSKNTEILQTYYGYTSMPFSINPGTDLDEGEYKLALTARYYGSDEWEEVLAPVGHTRAYKITVSAETYQVGDWTAQDEEGSGGSGLSAYGVVSLRKLDPNTDDKISFVGPFMVSAVDKSRKEYYLFDGDGFGILAKDSLDVLSDVEEGQLWKSCQVRLRRDADSFYWVVPQSYVVQESSVNRFSPVKLNLLQIGSDADKYQSSLVDLGIVFWGDEDSVFQEGKEYLLGNGNVRFPLDVYFPDVDYLGMKVRNGYLGVKGILTYSGGRYAVTPRSLSDLFLEFPGVSELEAHVEGTVLTLQWKVDSSLSVLPERFRVYVDDVYEGAVSRNTYQIRIPESGLHKAEVSALYSVVESDRVAVDFVIEGLGNENYGKNPCSIYPNPFRNVLNLETDCAGELRLISLEGKVLRCIRIPAAGLHTVDLADLVPGAYVSLFEAEGRVWFGKVVKR